MGPHPSGRHQAPPPFGLPTFSRFGPTPFGTHPSGPPLGLPTRCPLPLLTIQNVCVSVCAVVAAVFHVCVAAVAVVGASFAAFSDPFGSFFLLLLFVQLAAACAAFVVCVFSAAFPVVCAAFLVVCAAPSCCFCFCCWLCFWGCRPLKKTNPCPKMFVLLFMLFVLLSRLLLGRRPLNPTLAAFDLPKMSMRIFHKILTPF